LSDKLARRTARAVIASTPRRHTAVIGGGEHRAHADIAPPSILVGRNLHKPEVLAREGLEYVSIG
jgi:hypothetical protein